MRKLNIKTSIVFIAIGMLLFLGCKKTDLLSNTDKDYEYLPQDVEQSCVVTDAEFKTWFKGGTVTENGLVEPANSVTFPHNNNCDFYKWSEQMFLWITSPTSSGSYKSGGTVMESPVFYNVSAADKNGNRVLTPHAPNTIMSAVGNIEQTGPNRLPIVFDKSGKMFEVEPQEKNEAVKDAANKSVVVGKIIANANGLHSFVDTKGKAISGPKAIIAGKVHPENIVQEFKQGNKIILLDSKGNIIDTEQGQAGSSGALVASNNSLVYYITMVNDVYAYFLTGIKDKTLKAKEFPTTAAARDSILAYAKLKGFAPPPDPDALAMELKTSWVEAKDLPNAETYITIKAKIPVYDKTDPKLWKLTDKTTVTTLALVGMHVVGSVAGHPEMIWATFEHLKNAPNTAYSYTDVNGKVKQVKGDTGKGWLFNDNANDTVGGQNIQNMTVVNDTLNTDVIKIVNPALNSSKVRRIMAWGVASDTIPNAEDKTPANSNSEIISINNAVRKMLVGNDIRKNYLLIGATWTSGGVVPNGYSYPYNGTPPTPGNAIGTGRLANTTMETFFQAPSSNAVASSGTNAVTSCLYCHGYSLDPRTKNGISHIFSDIRALPTNMKNLPKLK
ncbi:hypothetical protein OA93_03635 [Flavobacterium sp. KMS]|uniref:hypothetical protein n=1 Tax=Flavobacterium sp. KMS TaxID=1566023 RepID=UPI00057C76FC|nr:hypothetical protein [Flavobacterium sp. KMS]KIA99913.1 hypothetical protein OA93_03635 [Flavobacterium sp. KMS]